MVWRFKFCLFVVFESCASRRRRIREPPLAKRVLLGSRRRSEQAFRETAYDSRAPDNTARARGRHIGRDIPHGSIFPFAPEFALWQCVAARLSRSPSSRCSNTRSWLVYILPELRSGADRGLVPLHVRSLLIAHAFSRSKATCTRLRRRLLPLARNRVRDNRSEKHDQLLNDARRRALFERYNRLDVALYRNATAIWCAEWYNAIGDRESCVRTYAHARPGTPSPCS